MLNTARTTCLVGLMNHVHDLLLNALRDGPFDIQGGGGLGFF